jgi:GMP synthase PP-ATPase subunit
LDVSWSGGLRFANPPYELGETATRIINEVKGVNRVVYDTTSNAGDD